MENLRLKQYRAIKQGFETDEVFASPEYGDWNMYLKKPIMGKTLADIEYNKYSNKDAKPFISYRADTKGCVFELWIGAFDHPAYTHYIITKNNQIIYHGFCSIFAKASNAWHTLTELFFAGHNDEMNWIWVSLHDAVAWNYAAGDAYRIDVRKSENVDDLIAKLSYWY